MADCILLKSGMNGIDPDELTAAASDVLKGKIAGVAGNDEPVEGTLELTGNVTASDIRKGKTAYSTNPKSKIIGTMAEQSGSTSTPGTANKTLAAANRYVTGNIIMAGDKNLTAANIIRGKTIFGVAGTAVYAGDIPGYLLLPPNEYVDLTGGWQAYRNNCSSVELTKPSANIVHFHVSTYMDDNALGADYQTVNSDIVNKYRYIYLDYKNLNVKWTGTTSSVWEMNLILSAFSSSVSIDIRKDITNKSGTMKLLVENTAGSTDRIKIRVYGHGNAVWKPNTTVTVDMDITAVRYDQIG